MFRLWLLLFGIAIPLYLAEGYLRITSIRPSLPINGIYHNERYTWGHLV